MTMYLGDYKEDDAVYFIWSSNDKNGASITRATDGTVSVYKDNSTAQSTAGVTDTEDFDSLTGIHHVAIDLSADAFYATGADYMVVLSAATIDGETVNAILAHFSIENRAAATADIADAVWDEAISGHTAGGSFGEEVQAHSLSTEISGLNDPTAADIADAVWDEAISGHTAGGSFGEEVQAHSLSSEISGLNDPSAADIADAVWDEAISGHTAGGSFGEEVQAHATPTEVNSQVDTALSDIDLDHFIQVSAGAEEPTAGSYLDQIMHKDGSQTFDQSTDSLEAIRDRGDAEWDTGNDPSAADIADAVWDEAKSGHTGVGSFGEEVQAHSLSSEISGLNDPSAADIADAVWDEAISGHTAGGSFGEEVQAHATPTEVNSQVDTALSDIDLDHFIQVSAGAEEPTAGSYLDQIMHKDGSQTFDQSTDSLEAVRDRGDAEWATGNDPSAADVADAVWDEAKSGHTAGGSFGEEVQAHSLSSEISGLNDPSAADVADAVWDEAISGHTAGGSFGEEVQAHATPTEVNSQVDTALSDIDLDHFIQVSAGAEEPTAGSYLDQIMHKDGSQTFDQSTDSLEAVRDRGDAAWVTGGGGSITDILNIQPLVPISIDLANTATWRLGLMLVNSLDDLPSTAEIDPGTIDIDRKAAGATSWSSVVSGAACSELAGLIYYDEVFDSGTGYAAGDSIRITFKSQLITVAANDYEISDANGRTFYTTIRETSTEIADQVWDEAISGHTAGGSFGEEVQAHATPTEVNSQVDTALSDIDLDHLIHTSAAGADPTVGTYLDLMMNKDGSQTFDPSTDSLEAIRDRGDAAWTGGGSTITDVLNVQPLVPISIDLANTATWRLGLMLINSLDDLPTTAEITPGTISIDRKAAGGTSWSSVVNGAACSELAGLIYYDEVFDSGTGYAAGDSIRITFKSQKITVAANDYEISDSNGRIFYTTIREPSATIADAVWDEAKSGHTGAGSFGEEVQAHSLSTEIAALNDPSAASIADQVWDEAKAGHTSAGTFGEEVQAHSLSSEIAALDDLSSTQVGDAVLDEVVEGTLTLRQMARLWTAALVNKSSGGGTTSITFRDVADGKNRITATVQASTGNRTSVSTDVS